MLGLPWWFIIAGIIILLFGFVVAFGAPYLPTLRPQSQAALDLLELPAGKHLLELGCGDGRVARAAAVRGLKVTAYELNPLLYVTARIVTWRQRSLVTIHLGNYWRAKWPPCDGIFVFLLDRYMPQLEAAVQKQAQSTGRNIRVASFTFKFPGRQPLRQGQGIYVYQFKPRA